MRVFHASSCCFPIPGRKRGITSAASCRWRCWINSPVSCAKVRSFALPAMIRAISYGRWNASQPILNSHGLRNRPMIGGGAPPIGPKPLTKPRQSPQAVAASICVSSAANSAGYKKRFKNCHGVDAGVQKERQQQRAAFRAQPSESEPEQKNLADEKPLILHMGDRPHRRDQNNGGPHAQRRCKAAIQKSAKQHFLLKRGQEYEGEDQQRQQTRVARAVERVGDEGRRLLTGECRRYAGAKQRERQDAHAHAQFAPTWRGRG